MNNSDKNPAPARRVGYMRVSTKRQTLGLQKAALRDAGCDVIYADHGISGKVVRRKGLSRALAALRPDDTLVVHRIDRLGRDMQHLARILSMLEDKKARFHSLSQSVDVGSASGKLVFYIFAAFAEFESHINGERTKGGMRASKAKGAKLGRNIKLTDQDVVSARKMLKNGSVSYAIVADILDVSTSTLRRALKRRESEAA